MNSLKNAFILIPLSVTILRLNKCSFLNNKNAIRNSLKQKGSLFLQIKPNNAKNAVYWSIKWNKFI
jgi:hypothetical protein